MFGRIDYDKFYNSARELKDVDLLPEGGAMKKSGRFFVKETKHSDKNSRIEEFTFSSNDALIIEIGDEYMRFYKNNAAIELSSAASWITSTAYIVGEYTEESGVIYYCIEAHTSGVFATDLAADKWVSQVAYEIPTIYNHIDVFNLQLFQDSDLIYITHPDYPEQVLTRNSDVDFTLEEIEWIFPPMLDENSTTSHTMQSSTTSGTTTITSSLSFFDAGHVGGYLQIGGEVSSKRGFVKITAVASSTSATATVINTLSTAGATSSWAEGASSDYRGHMAGVCVYQNRLCFGQFNRIYLSETGIFENFYISDGSEDSMPIVKAYTFGKYNIAKWLIASEVIFIGTDGGIVNMIPAGSEVMTPGNAIFSLQDSNGVSVVQPILVSNRLYYIHRDSQQIMEYFYSFDYDSFGSESVTLRAKGVVPSGIREMSYQQSPYNQIHCVLNNGDLVSLTRNITEDVKGLTNETGNFGVIRSTAVIPKQFYDEVWSIAEYEINGNTVQYIEYRDDPRSHNLHDHLYTHASVSYRGVATDELTGLDHLEGQTIQVRANGQVQADLVVSSGKVTLQREYTSIDGGLGYTARIKTQNFELGIAGTVGLILLKKIARAYVYFVDTFSATIGNSNHMEIDPALKGNVIGDTAPEGYTGIVEAPLAGDTSRSNAHVTAEQEKCTAMLVNCIAVEVSI